MSPSPCWQFQSDKPDPLPLICDETDDYSTIHYSSISLESDGPLYENTISFIEPPSPILLSYTSENDVDDHIYDYVDNSSVDSRPANIFLSLVDDKGSTISPDPNIYEVPPGAIFNSDSSFEELFPLSHISPPKGFQDKLTWERLHLITNNCEDNNEAIYSLPIKFNLNGSAIVKSRKKKLRPSIEELLNQITIMKEVAVEDSKVNSSTEGGGGGGGGEEASIQLKKTKDDSLHNDETADRVAPEIVVAPLCCPITISDCSTSNEVIVDNINEVIPSNLTVLQASVDSLPVQLADTREDEVSSSTESNPKDFTSIIEISGDGTWNTAKIPASNLDSTINSETNITNEVLEEDFLTSSADVRAKHVNLAYSGQYYTGNCPVASIKPMKHDDDGAVDVKKNIGAQIMEKYEEERKKIIEIKNLPDVSLLDVDESLEEIQKERRKIIESQAVKAKRIDSWIKGRPVPLDEDGSPMKCMEGMEFEETCSSQGSVQNDSINMYLDENGEVVYDSIIQNKNKIKSYWEQLMLAAELANQSPVKPAHQQNHPLNTPPTSPAAPAAPATTPASATSPSAPVPPPPPAPVINHVVTEKIHSPDLSETEFYDALSHVSAVQTPDLIEKEVDGLKLSETVVERDIRIQQERELALMIERQKALKSVKDKVVKTSVMKEKEEDLQKQPDEAYLSIPTTDEGNFSEYGSEDKEDHSPDGSRVMSPVGPAVISSHHRTQSLDSMSSGHSSGSGTVSHPDLSITKAERRQTFGPVKPLDEPDDIDILSYVKYEKETPIEREIRLARDREEELRREQRVSVTPLTKSPPQKSELEKKENSPQAIPQRVAPATQRVQHEIEVASEREKELKRWSSDDLQKVNTKVLLKPTARKLNPLPIVQNGDVSKEFLEPPKTPNSIKNGGASPKIYIQNPQQKGLMKRFLASRGKMSSSPKLSSVTSPTSATLPPLKTPSVSPGSIMSEPYFSFTSLVQSKDREDPVNLGARPGYKSAEDKIQTELKEMKRREEELRQQRRSNLYSARSQPDLLNIMNDPMTERESNFSEEEPARLPNMSKLRSALSVQNLLDVSDKPIARRMPKRKSALIEQWESRIQNKN